MMLAEHLHESDRRQRQALDEQVDMRADCPGPRLPHSGQQRPSAGASRADTFGDREPLGSDMGLVVTTSLRVSALQRLVQPLLAVARRMSILRGWQNGRDVVRQVQKQPQLEAGVEARKAVAAACCDLRGPRELLRLVVIDVEHGPMLVLWEANIEGFRILLEAIE